VTEGVATRTESFTYRCQQEQGVAAAGLVRAVHRGVDGVEELPRRGETIDWGFIDLFQLGQSHHPHICQAAHATVNHVHTPWNRERRGRSEPSPSCSIFGSSANISGRLTSTDKPGMGSTRRQRRATHGERLRAQVDKARAVVSSRQFCGQISPFEKARYGPGSDRSEGVPSISESMSLGVGR